MARSMDLVLATRTSLPRVFVKRKCLLFIGICAVQLYGLLAATNIICGIDKSCSQRCIFVLRLDKVYNT